MSSSQSNSRKRSLAQSEETVVELSDAETRQETDKTPKGSRARVAVTRKGLKPHPTKEPREGRSYIVRNTKKRAAYWADFVEFLNPKEELRVECNFCEKDFASDSNLNGTTKLKHHWKNCLKNPANKTKGKQSHLTFNLIPGGEKEFQLKYREVTVEDVGRALIYMIILGELPYRIVDRPGFRYFMSVVIHIFKIPSRYTIARDCYKLYLDERSKLKDFLKNSCQRVCVTTDTWTSVQRINYMCLTAHFIDDNWKLQKRILNFCPISSHKGDAIGKPVEDCLNTWDLGAKLFTVTVDNASSNDVACVYLKKVVKKNGGISEGKYLHIRCVAHIINLIVWSGLRDHGIYIDKVRAAIKYVRNSPARIVLFNEQVEKCKIECRLSLSLDVPTRWNSTYMMLDRALKYMEVFSRIGLPSDLDPENLGPIDDDDWDKLGKLVFFLKEFYDLTNRISGSLYVTSNSLFFQIGHTHDLLTEWLMKEDPEFQEMAIEMKDKFDKYWGEVEKMNMLIYLAVIMDPSFKFLGVSIALCGMYGQEKGESLANNVKLFAYEIYDEYRHMYGVGIGDNGENVESVSSSSSSSKLRTSYMCNIEQQVKKQMSGANPLIRPEFDRYLNEPKGDDEEKEILPWWRANAVRFPILAHMARDIIAIPISTVASEAAFSVGGRTLDQFRSSLTPKMVQAQICCQDWIRASLREAQFSMEENIEELEKLETDIEKLKVQDDVIVVS